MINIQLHGTGLDALHNLAEEFPKEIPRAFAIINNGVAKFQVREIDKSVRKHVAIKSKGVKESLVITKKASSTSPVAEITVEKNERAKLKYFGARQTKKGVSYRIGKSGKRSVIKGAFISKKLGGHVYKRSTKKRLPIKIMRGVSVARVFQVNNLVSISQEQIAERMEFEALRRVRSIQVRAIKRAGKAQGLSVDQINQKIKSL